MKAQQCFLSQLFRLPSLVVQGRSLDGAEAEVKELENRDFFGRTDLWHLGQKRLKTGESKNSDPQMEEDDAARWRWGTPQGHTMLARCGLSCW